jgi:SAM-dependent methyltransferase
MGGAFVTKRARDDLEAQYAIERALAQRLREAPGSERARLYGELYDELFRRVPNHPQIQKDPAERDREVGERLEFMARFLRPDATLMELGAGDCAFSVRAAALVRQVLAVDVSSVIAEVDSPCENLTVVLSDGTSVPVAEGSVDVAYSDQLMEHLHPDDAIAQLANIHRALRPGAPYVCITPNAARDPMTSRASSTRWRRASIFTSTAPGSSARTCAPRVSAVCGITPGVPATTFGCPRGHSRSLRTRSGDCPSEFGTSCAGGA